MNQCLSRRWALPPHLRSPRTRSPRPCDRPPGRLADRAGDPIQHVTLRLVDGRQPRRRRFRQDDRHAEHARPHDDRPSAARAAQDRHAVGPARVDMDIVVRSGTTHPARPQTRPAPRTGARGALARVGLDQAVPRRAQILGARSAKPDRDRSTGCSTSYPSIS